MTRSGILLLISMLLSVACVSAQHIVAHRGMHSAEGAEQNSLAALRAAEDANIYGVECDVNMTADGELVVIHGPWLGDEGDSDRINIQRSNLATIRSQRLDNGEPVPTLDEFLQQVATNPTIHLYIEIKEHATSWLESEVAQKVVAAVREYQLQDNVTYLSFSQHLCNELRRYAPSSTAIAYLGSNLAPRLVERLGYTDICYRVKTLKRRSRWIAKAHGLGLRVGVWTVNSVDDARWARSQGVDYIITDDPMLVESVVNN